MKTNNFRRGSASIFTLVFCFALTMFGQSDSGSAAIEGTVKDQNGAVVQGATVLIKNKETGLERTVTSNANGLFSASVLPVGTYTITARSQGFAESTSTVRLTVGEVTPIEIAIAPQGANASVNVNADADVINRNQKRPVRRI